MPVVFLMQTAFSLWMLSHALRCDAPRYWWLVVLLPFGEWVYFLAVYLPSRRGRHKDFSKYFARPPSLGSLMRAHRQTPSNANLLRLAQGLFDAGKFQESNERFAEALEADSTDQEALFGYAHSARCLRNDEAAIDALEHLTGQKLEYRGYSAAFLLASLYRSTEQDQACIELLRRVTDKTLRVEPRLRLAKVLHEIGRHAEAQQALEEGLDAYAGSPSYTRRQQRTAAWKARRMLRKLA